MKAAFALLTTLLAATSTLAAPSNAVPTVTLSLINDQTGRNAAVSVPTNSDNLISSLFAGSAIDQGGAIMASSAQLTAFKQGQFCTLTNAAGQRIAVLNAQQTYADVDGDYSRAVPVSLNGAKLHCELPY